MQEPLEKHSKRKDAFGLWTFYDGGANGPAPFDFVAVQGLNAHPYYTWTAEAKINRKCNGATIQSNRVCWLEDFLPEDVPNARILTFSYNSNYQRNSPVTDLETYAGGLLEALKSLRDQKQQNRPIIFLGHSFGGIVIEKALCKAAEHISFQDIYHATCGVIFLGTPFRGSTLADPASRLFTIARALGLGSEPGLLVGLRPESKEYEELSKKFSSFVKDRKLYFFSETLKTSGVKIVERIAASFGEVDEKRFIEMNKDHSGMNKFTDRTDADYKALVEKLVELVKFSGRWRLRDLEKFYARKDHEIHWDRLENDFPRMRANRFESTTYKPSESPPWNKGTCEWLLHPSMPIYKWLTEDKSSFLWIRGRAGCGKTVLSSYLISKLMNSESKPVVLYFFIKGTEKATFSNPIGILTEILGQLAFDDAFKALEIDVETTINNITTTDSSNAPAAYFAILRKAFLEWVKVVGKVYCIIDGLDECDHSNEVWDDFISFLVELGSTTEAEIKLAVFSRDDRSLFKAFPLAEPIEYTIRSSDVEGDIDIMVRNGLMKVEIPSHIKPDELVKLVVGKAKGIFIWAKSAVQHLDLNYQGKELLSHIEALPSDMDLLYGRILQATRDRIGAKDLESQRRVISLVMAAPSPVHINEVAYADVPELDPHLGVGNIDCWAQRILSLCAPLIQVDGDTVELVHISAKDYLNKTGTGEDLNGTSFRLSDKEGHTEVAKLCLSYLLGDFFQEPYAKIFNSEGFGKDHFIRYAPSKWCFHLSRADKDEELLGLFDRFFSSSHSSNWLDTVEAVLDQEDFCANFRYLFTLNYRIQNWLQLFPNKANESDVFINRVIERYERNYEIAKISLGRVESQFPVAEKAALDDYRFPFFKRANELAEAYGWLAGGTAKAEKILREVLPEAKDKFGGSHDATVALARNLAFNCKRQGKYQEAVTQLLELLNCRENWVPTEMSFIRDSLGWVYSRLQNWTEAARYLELSVDGTKQELGYSKEKGSVASRLTLRTRFTLAEVYRKQGLLEDAERLLNEILEVLPKVKHQLSPEDSMTCTNFKAGIEMERGNYLAAAESYRDIAEARTKVWGTKNHPAVLWAEQQRALAYQRQNDLQQAIKIYVSILPIQETILRPDHPNTLETISSLWGIFELTRVLGRTSAHWEAFSVLLPQERILRLKHEDKLDMIHKMWSIFEASRSNKDLDTFWDLLDIIHKLVLQLDRSRAHEAISWLWKIFDESRQALETSTRWETLQAIEDHVLRMESLHIRETITHLWAIFTETYRTPHTKTRWHLLGLMIRKMFEDALVTVQRLASESRFSHSRKMLDTTTQKVAVNIGSSGEAIIVSGTTVITTRRSSFIQLTPRILILSAIFVALISSVLLSREVHV